MRSPTREPRVFVPTEVALQNLAVGGAVEHRAPPLPFAYTIRGFFRVEFRCACQLLTYCPPRMVSAQMHLPVVAGIDIRQRRRDATFRHDGVCFAQSDLHTSPTDTPAERFAR